MANPIKYTNATQSNSIKTSNFAIGVNNGGYGPTNITNFYNGKTPNVGGYTVYVSNGVGSPSVFVAGNDATLITLSNQLGGSGITTISGALNFFNSSSTMLCTNMDYPNIVTSGLVLNLDAAYTPSYPKNGTTWTDLSGNGNNGTLVNGPSFSSLDGGSIIFDGVDDLCTTTYSLSSQRFSLCFWIKVPSTLTQFKKLFQTSGTDLLIYIEQNLGITFRIPSDGTFFAPGTLTLNQWGYVSCIYDNSFRYLYIDGVLRGQIATVSENVNLSNLSINRIDRKLNCFMSQTSLYNRALSSSEILQNYYAGLQRFIPTDSLVLSLDGSNTDKQVATASTAYDMSGNNNNGTLNNGVALVSDGQRAFSFDGVNDVVTTSFNTLPSSTTWTIWVKRTQSVNNFNMMMGMSLPYFAFRSNGDIHFSNSIGDVQRSLFATPNLANNVWYFMSFVSSFSGGNTTMLIYLNGSLQSQRTDAGQQKTTTDNNFRLGGWTNTGTEPFKGNIGQVGIYNRVLTATEISTIYTASKSRYTPSTTEIKNVFKSRVLEDLGLFEAESCLEGQLNVISNQYLLESASLMVTANAYKEGKLYSVVPFELNGDMVVTRATTATRVNSVGLIEDTPYNLLQQSENFTVSPWIFLGSPNVTITANTGTSPIGANNATLLTSNSTSSFGIRQSVTISPNTQYVFSCWVRSNTPTEIRVDISDLNNTSFNLTNIWQRIQVLGTYNNSYAATLQFVDIVFGPNQLGSSFFIWGAQLVVGNQVKDYFPTTNRFNIPRIDYSNGSCPSILVEPQRTNLVIQSEQINLWTGGLNTTVTPNVSIGPNGIPTANNINITNINGYWRRLGLNLASSTTYTASVFVKKSVTTNNKTFSFYYNNNVSSPNNGEYRGVVNLTNLTITTTTIGTITTGRPTIISSLLSDYGNGWYRVIVIFTTGSSAGSSNSEIGFLANGEVVDFDAWGAQLELGTPLFTNETSYIPTTTAAVTRNADVISKTSATSLIGQTEGTILVKGYQLQRGVILRISNSLSTNNQISIFCVGVDGRCEYGVRKNNISVSNSSVVSPNLQTNKNIIIKYSQTSIKVFINGVLFWNYTYPSSTDFTATLDKFDFGSLTENATAKFEMIALWKKQLTDVECINLTTL